MNVFLFFVSFFWLVVILDKIFFWTWLWQLKEYRLDRVLAHFELESSRKIFFNKIYVVKFILFLGTAVNLFGFRADNLKSLLAAIILVFYGTLSFWTLIKFPRLQSRLPLATKKAILMIGFNVLTLLTLARFLAFTNFIFFLTGLLAIDILLVVLVSLWAALLKFPTDFFKEGIIKKAKEKRAKFKDLLVIGITGSYGKTSIKEILAHILAKKLNVLKTEANQNTEIGISRTVLDRLRPEHQIFVVEMAAYKIGEIKKICEIVQPKIGILTAIGSQHLSLFGSRENTIKGKYELIESLPDRGLAIFNGDNEYCRKLYEQTKKPKLIYSVANSRLPRSSPEAMVRGESENGSLDIDILAKDVKVFKNGLEFTVFAENEEQNFRTKLVGVQNVSNILAAVTVALELGMGLSEISDAVTEIKPFPHTLEIKKGINDTILIDDSYSANFEGVMAALDYISLHEESKKVMIFYPMIELGKMARELHRKVGEKIGKVCDLCILTSPDFSKEIIEGAVSSRMNPKNILMHPNSAKSARGGHYPNAPTRIFIDEKPASVINKVKSFVKKGDVVLVENRVSEEIIRTLGSK